MEVNLILLKNAGKDCNGLPNYIFATDKQVDYLAKLRNNVEKRYCFVKLGNYLFSPIDILYIRKENDYGGAVPKYYIEQCKKDNGTLDCKTPSLLK